MSGRIHVAVAVFAMMLGGALAGPLLADGPAPASQPAAADLRVRFQQVRQAAERTTNGRAGRDLWQQFLKDVADGPLADLARKELAVWRERADKGLVRFGPDWLAEAEVAQRTARADSLLEKAAAAANPKDKARLLAEAVQANPWKVEIRFAIALLHYQGHRPREFGVVMGEVLRIEPNHPAALNNLGVLAVDSKNWSAAMTCLVRAAERGAGDVALDNLEQVIALAEAAGCRDSALAPARAQVRAIVAAMQRAGQHADQARWAGRWVSRKDYETFLAVNRMLDGQIEQARARLANLARTYQLAKTAVDNYDKNRRWLDDQLRDDTPYRIRCEIEQKKVNLKDERDKAEALMPQLEQEAKKVQDQIADLAAKKHVEALPGQLVLLGPDGKSELATIQLDRRRRKPPPAPASQPEPPPSS